jgi:hypothetical protein
MARLIRRLWAAFWLPAEMTDAQLSRLLRLQPHQLIALDAAAPHAITYSKGRRMWRLVDTLPAAVRLRR